MPEETTEKEEKMHEQQMVIFKIAGEEFGVNINEVKEINRWVDVTRIPNSAAYIKGVINLRGNIIVVTDLAMKLGLPSKEIDDDTRILVVEVGNDQTVGMVVDSATEVMRLSGDKIRDAPSMITSNIDRSYIEGVGLLDEKRLLTLLNLAKVLESQDYEKIMNAQKMAKDNIRKKEPTTKTAKPKKEEKPKEEEIKPEPEIKEEKSETKTEDKPEPKEEKPAEEPAKADSKPKTEEKKK